MHCIIYQNIKKSSESLLPFLMLIGFINILNFSIYVILHSFGRVYIITTDALPPFAFSFTVFCSRVRTTTVSRNHNRTPLNGPSIMFEQIATVMDVSCRVPRAILHVYRRRARREFAFRFAKETRRKCSRSPICGSLIVSPSWNQFFRIATNVFLSSSARYQTRHPRPIIDPSMAFERVMRACSDLFFRVIDILGCLDYTVLL